MQKFELAIVRPISGKKGELVFSMTKQAASISDAVKSARQDINGSGLIVLQAASYHADEPQNGQIMGALVSAYDQKFGGANA